MILLQLILLLRLTERKGMAFDLKFVELCAEQIARVATR
jgi:hypothetical protein